MFKPKLVFLNFKIIRNIELNESLIKEKIGEIIDSDLNKSLAELNSVKKIILTDKAVQVYVELIGPYHWIYTRIKSQIKKVLVSFYLIKLMRYSSPKNRII